MSAKNVINHVVIHDLQKHGGTFQVAPGADIDKITVTAQRVVDELHGLYSKRSSKAHGKFSTDKDNYPVQRYLQDFMDGRNPSFRDLTLRMMATLTAQASRKTAATGGYVFFANFEREARKYLMVAIVNNRLGATLTKALELQDAQHLDLDGFRFAGRIDITGWENSEERYVGFLKGKGDVAEYFKEFLGCDTPAQDRVDTLAVVNILTDFATSKKMSVPERDNFLRKAKVICEDLARRHKPISFQEFSNELYPIEPDQLVELLADPDKKLSDGFVPDRRALNSLVKFKARTRFWSVEFDRQAISEGAVIYNKKDGTLLLRDLPQELLEALRSDDGTDDVPDHI